MGKGQIINNFGDGRYAVKLLQNRVQADKALARIDTWIALNQTRQDSLPPGDPEHKLPMLKLSMASLLKQKGYLLLIPQDAIADAWCADLTEELSGEVGTIEINGDPTAAVNIRPGYTDNAAHVPARDGQAMNIRAMTPEQAFYNLAMMPGWQKWRPTYRVGAITSIDGDTCSVRLDDANSSLKGAEYNINQAWDLTDVDIEYMDCDGSAFEVGDRVIVQFVTQDFGSPMVIGFESEPKSCYGMMIIAVNPNNNIDFYDYNYKNNTMKLKKTLDLSYLRTALWEVTTDINGNTTNWTVDPTSYLQVLLMYADSDMNTLVVKTFVSPWRNNSQYTFDVPDPAHPWMMLNNFYPVKIPLDFVDNSRIEAGLRTNLYGGARVPTGNSLSQSGQTVTTIFNGSNSNVVVQNLTEYIDRTFTVAYYTYTVWSNPSYEFLSPGVGFSTGFYRERGERPIVIGVHGDRIITITQRYDTSIDMNTHIFYMTIHAAIGIERVEIPLTDMWGQDNHKTYGASQIIGHNDKIYVFYSNTFGSYSDFQLNIEVAVYDLALNLLRPILPIPLLSGTVLGRVTIVNNGTKDLMSVPTAPYPIIELTQTVTLHFLDIDTLTVENVIAMPQTTTLISHTYRLIDAFSYPNVIAVSKPRNHYIVQKINEYRFQQPDYVKSLYLLNDYPMKLSWVGYSSKLEACAQEHVDWCVANGRYQHEDINGDSHYVRSERYGFIGTSVAEILAIYNISLSKKEGIDESIRLWKTSPHHNAVLVRPGGLSIGYATANYPESVHELISGPGQYIPETGGYTTSPSTEVLNPSQYGKRTMSVMLMVGSIQTD